MAQIMENASMAVVDQGVTTLSWSNGQTVIPLTKTIDPSKHLTQINYAGGLGVIGEFYYWELQANSLVIRGAFGNNGDATALPWQILRVPAGNVQRGISTIPIYPGDHTTDIPLDQPVTSDAFLALCNAGRFLTAGPAPGYVVGSVRIHPSDNCKIQVVTSFGAGTAYGSGPVAWEVWSL